MRLRDLGGQGAELDILRHWDLRGLGGKMHPAGSDGKKGFSSGPVCARPRLPALIPLTPEPGHGGGHRAIGILVICMVLIEILPGSGLLWERKRERS